MGFKQEENDKLVKKNINNHVPGEPWRLEKLYGIENIIDGLNSVE